MKETTRVYETPPFFGRKTEIEDLRRRVRKPGLTVVKGRPRIGKTRLLEELVSRLRAEKQALVGMVEIAGGEGDFLLRAVADAYDHWLKDASAVDQLRFFWEKHRSGLVGRVGTAIGEIVGEAVGESGLLIPGGKTAGGIIKGVFGGLQRLDDELRSGGLHVVPIQADEAESLLRIMAHAQDRPIVLVLNQWEESLSLKHDFTTLQTFLHNIFRWPSTHILLHLRSPLHAQNVNQDAADKAQYLVKTFPQADTLEIDAIDFLQDAGERERLLGWLHKCFPGTKQINGEVLVSEVIAGNPGVFQEWLNLDQSVRRDCSILRKKARDAHANLYPEIEPLLLQLLPRPGKKDEHGRQTLAAALRLAVIPRAASTESWAAVKDPVLGGLHNSLLTDFEACKYLWPSPDRLPYFGHPTRHEAARHLALEHDSLRPYTRVALERLVEELVEMSPIPGNLADAGQDIVTRHSLLSELSRSLTDIEAALICRQLAAAAGTFFLRIWPAELRVIDRVQLGSLPDPQTRLLARGLFNAFDRSGSDRSQTDGLLSELRALVQAHPGDATARYELAKALVNALYDVGTDKNWMNALLGDLRAQAEAHPDDAAIRCEFAYGLVNGTMQLGMGIDQTDILLDDLRALTVAHPGDRVVCRELARGLSNAIGQMLLVRSDENRTDALLRELRTLHTAYTADREILTALAVSLFNGLFVSRSDRRRVDILLSELRGLCEAYPDERSVRELLAKGLVNALENAGSDKGRADALLNELRALSETDAAEERI